MFLKTSLFPVSGYTGFLKQPNNERIMDTSVFFITDKNKRELNVILTQPGSYNTVYRVASQVNYQEINIFALSFDVNFLSDVYRLSHDLKALHKYSVHTIFPEDFPVKVDPITKLNHIHSSVFKSKIDLNISIEYHVSDETLIDDNLPAYLQKGINYDLIIHLGNKIVFIPAKLTERNLKKWCCLKDLEIHLPYNQTLYGGWSYSDIKDNTPDLFEKSLLNICRINCFSNIEEYTLSRNDGTEKIADFVQTSLYSIQ